MHELLHDTRYHIVQRVKEDFCSSTEDPVFHSTSRIMKHFSEVGFENCKFLDMLTSQAKASPTLSHGRIFACWHRGRMTRVAFCLALVV